MPRFLFFSVFFFRFSMFQFSLSPIARKTIYSYAFSIFRLLRNIIAFQIALHIERHTKYHITHSLAMPFILFFRCASVSSVYLLFFPLFLLLLELCSSFHEKRFRFYLWIWFGCFGQAAPNMARHILQSALTAQLEN